MTDTEPDLAARLTEAAGKAIWQATLREPPLYGQKAIDADARAAVTAVLKTLVDEHFPDDDVDYHYACEGLAQDACDTLRQLDEAEDQ